MKEISLPVRWCFDGKCLCSLHKGKYSKLLIAVFFCDARLGESDNQIGFNYLNLLKYQASV